MIWEIWLERAFLFAAGVAAGLAYAFYADLRDQRRAQDNAPLIVGPDGAPLLPPT